ncbi:MULTISPECIES: hypothetical protein [Psychrobacter]|uniref:hypothetical protein n=1 Tax=Psychrobacter TaxID=497 RepID=UPI00146B6A7B|nr:MULTISPECIES: hypothetical protein [Psychrobacter]
MSGYELIIDLADNQIWDKLVPTKSPYADQIRRLVMQIINLVSDDDIEIINSPALAKTADFNEIDGLGVIEEIVRLGKTGAWAATYMMMSFYHEYGEIDSNSPAWRFMSGYLKVMFLITARHDKHFAKIDKLGVRIRMGLKPHDPQRELINKLIEIHESRHNLSSCLTDIRLYEVQMREGEASGKKANNNLASKIGQIRLAYEVVIKNKAFVSKDYGVRDDKPSVNVIKSVEIIDEVPFETLVFQNNGTPPSNNVALAENTADDQPIPLLDNQFKPSKVIAKSSELQQWQLKNNYQHARRNQFYFPTNHRQLSITGYQRLFATLWQRFIDLIENKQDKEAYAVLLLTMLSGLGIDNVTADWQRDRSQRQYFVYDSKSKVTSIAITINVTVNRRSHLLSQRQSYGSTFHRALPKALQSMLENKTAVSLDHVKSVIASIKNELNIPALSRQHIDSALFVIIKNGLNRPLHADALTGVDVRHSSALYYTSHKVMDLEQTYQTVVKLLTLYCGANQQERLINECNKAMNGQKKRIGSDMTLKVHICQNFFNQLAMSAKSFNNKLNASIDRYIEQFNSYTIWLWHIIMIQTGIRPVNHAPGFLNQFDFNRRLFWVSDKEIRSNQADGRLIPMSGFLITAIKNYLNYINQFAAIYNPLFPNTAYPIDHILNSKQPLLQLYQKNPQGFVGITPGRVRYQLQGFFSHQDNWLRHQLRSMLTGRVSDQLICALYGHEHPDQEFMHPMSSNFINQLHTLSLHLEAIADELYLQQIEVWPYGK